MPGEKGGLVANVNYLSRRYKNKLGPEDHHVGWYGTRRHHSHTASSFCNLAASIANRGYFFTPHIHKNVDWSPLSSRFTTPRQTKVPPYIYADVIKGMTPWL